VATRHRIARLAEPLALGTILWTASGAAPAFAYLDPGTGSMMLQLLLGGVAGAMVVGKIYFRKVTDFLRHIGRRQPTA